MFQGVDLLLFTLLRIYLPRSESCFIHAENFQLLPLSVLPLLHSPYLPFWNPHSWIIDLNLSFMSLNSFYGFHVMKMSWFSWIISSVWLSRLVILFSAVSSRYYFKFLEMVDIITFLLKFYFDSSQICLVIFECVFPFLYFVYFLLSLLM